MTPLSEINDVAAKQIENIRTKCEKIKPLVVVRSLTYNHEKYLKDALEGFVNQKTTFPFVVIVHEDASTDGTAQILKEYAIKYPDIILPIFEQENQYSKRDGSLGRIVNTASKLTGAKYIALCEGDDYWTDPHKLQKQVVFLESNEDYVMCFTDIDVLNQEKQILYMHTMEYGYYQRPLNFESLLINESYIAPPTWLIRFDKYPTLTNQYVDGTFALALELFANYKVGYISDSTAIYRLHSSSITHTKDPSAIFNRRLGTCVIQENFITKYRNQVSNDSIKIIRKKYFRLWLLACAMNKLDTLEVLYYVKEKGIRYFVLNLCFNNKVGRKILLTWFKRRNNI